MRQYSKFGFLGKIRITCQCAEIEKLRLLHVNFTEEYIQLNYLSHGYHQIAYTMKFATPFPQVSYGLRKDVHVPEQYEVTERRLRFQNSTRALLAKVRDMFSKMACLLYFVNFSEWSRKPMFELIHVLMG